ncbi:MAG TPA: hypothetical protein PLE85_02950 [Bacteroidales bacterium]|nr:hypothetical protein [Lentimicrobiaceae bacterium]HOH99475.1 hypothetical protein [Bacteroidales bacterium]
MKKLALQIALSVVIIILAFLVYESIMAPVRFNKEKDKRSVVVIERLKDIRSAQLLFKSNNGRYTASFDTLIDFIQTGQIPVVKMVADPTDTTFTRSFRDTVGYIVVRDSLFRGRESFNLQDLKIIPFSDGELVQMNAGTIERSNMEVNVFEVVVDKHKYLKGLDEHFIRQDYVKDIKVGSMTDPSTDGNWE